MPLKTHLLEGGDYPGPRVLRPSRDRTTPWRGRGGGIIENKDFNDLSSVPCPLAFNLSGSGMYTHLDASADNPGDNPQLGTML